MNLDFRRIDYVGDKLCHVLFLQQKLFSCGSLLSTTISLMDVTLLEILGSIKTV